jgi:hypothetical protein
MYYVEYFPLNSTTARANNSNLFVSNSSQFTEDAVGQAVVLPRSETTRKIYSKDRLLIERLEDEVVEYCVSSMHSHSIL